MRRLIVSSAICILAVTTGAYAQYVGQAINMFQSPVGPGDPAQRQLESEITVDPFNAGRLFGVAIDYRIANITGESWCAYTYSNNGGKIWKNKLFKGNPVEGPANHPLYGMKTCGDPVIAAGMIPTTGGYVARYFFGGLAFVRGGVRKVFVTRMTAPVDGSMPDEEFTKVIDTSSASGQGNATDKPAILFVPPGMPNTPTNGHGVVHLTYVGFLGSTGGVGKVFYSRSTDGGVTFSMPVRLDGNLGVNNGTAMAVAPDGTLYTAFRSYEADNGMYVVRSTDGGASWTKPIQVAFGKDAFFPYDQPALPTAKSPGFIASRNPAFPTIAVTRLGVLLMAWQEFVNGSGVPASPVTKKGGPPVAGVTPRIVVTVSTDKGNTWLPRKAAEMGPADAYQIFPRLGVGGDWASLLFMDARNILLPQEAGYPANGLGRALDYVAEFDGSYMNGVDRKIHTRIMQVNLGTGSSGLPRWNASKQVSQYLRSTTDRIIDEVAKTNIGKIIQRPHPLTGNPSGVPADDLLNPPNFSSGGAFIGDYNGIVTAQQFKKSATRSGFELTLDATDIAARNVYVAYVSTQNVQLPTVGAASTDWWKNRANWPPYNPDPANCVNPWTRNTDEYFNAISPGVIARWTGTSGVLKNATGGTLPQEFILQVENTSDQDRFFRIRFTETPAGEIWSFLQTFDTTGQPVHQTVIETQILKNDTFTRAIYRRSSGTPAPGSGVDVVVEEIPGLLGGPLPPITGGLSTTLSYRISPADTILTSQLHVVTAQTDPTVSFTPTGLKTSKFGNTQFENTQFENTQFENTQFENTQFENTQFENSPKRDAITSVTNLGSLATATNITSTLVNGQNLLDTKFDFQLLFFGVQSFPAANPLAPLSCIPSEIQRTYLISNIVVDSNTRPPETTQFENRQIGNTQFENTQFENTQFENTQFENSPIGDAQISNASLYLESGATNYFILRSYEPQNDPNYDPSNPNQIAQVSTSQQLNPGDTTRTATFRDNTGPDIKSFVTPTPNAAGWNNTTPVQVSFTVVDAGSGVASMEVRIDNIVVSNDCKGPFSFTAETAGTTIKCKATNGAGTPSELSVVVKIDKTKPTLSFGPTNPPPNDAGWNNSLPVTIAFTTNDNLSGVASTTTPSPLTFTSETTGASISVTVTDVAGNYDTFTSQVVKIDTTLPVITGSQSPVPNNGGWNNTNVTVSFTCADIGVVQSGLGANNVAGATLTSEGANQSVTNTGTCTDIAGNIALAKTVGPINIDKTKPLITGSRTPANGLGWNKTDVVVSFTCAETGNVQSGIATDTVAGSTVTSEGTNQSVTNSGSCIDTAGNSAVSATVSGINIDKTVPTILLTSPADGGTYPEGSSITATYSCSDDRSGIVPENCVGDQPNGSIFSAGSAGGKTFTVKATDKAGNEASQTNNYTVVAP